MSKKVAFTTLGCKLNFSETSGIAQKFEAKGYQRVLPEENADVFIINTCTVTELANKKSKQAIRKIIKNNPGAKVVAVGCYSQLKPGEVQKIEGVDLVLGADNKFLAPDFIEKMEAGVNFSTTVSKPAEKGFTPTYSYGDRTRSFLKVQDGCDYFCSYCTIPRARGKSRNNSVIDTVKVAREIVGKGIKEIILTGVNIGDFGRSTGETFFELIQQLDKIDGLERLRISSIEPNLLTDEILEFVAKSQKVVPHFHIPLQCGTDNLLRLMRRRYTTQVYKKRVKKIKQLMPDACIAADVIVGVPGETEDEFQKACEFIKQINISYLHVFTYSERENTLAIKMPNQVSIEERKRRSKIMHQIGSIKQAEFHDTQLNSIREVLFEHESNGKYSFGFTDNYIRVQVPEDKSLANKIVRVKLKSIGKNNIVNGEIIE